MSFVLLAILSCVRLAAQDAQKGGSSPQPPVKELDSSTVDHYLLRWQQAVTQLRSLEADCTRIDFDKAFHTETVWTGRVMLAKPGRGYLKLNKKGGKEDDYEQVVVDGARIFCLYGAAKTEFIFELPEFTKTIIRRTVLDVLFNPETEGLKKRYKIGQPEEDPHYVYLYINSVTPEDKSIFTHARLTFRKKNFFFKELWFVESTGNEVRWTLSNAKIDGELDPKNFEEPQVPKDWKVERAFPFSKNSDKK